MHLIKEKYDIDEILNNKINNILKFLNIKDKLVEGNIKNTKFSYIEPHKLKINTFTLNLSYKWKKTQFYGIIKIVNGVIKC